MILTSCSVQDPVGQYPKVLEKTIAAFVISLEPPDEMVATMSDPGEGLATLSPLDTDEQGISANIDKGEKKEDENQPPGPPSSTLSAETKCNLAGAGAPIDVTIPDGAFMKPGQYFSKTWRLVNLGNCAWTQDYAVVWFSGENFDAQIAQPLKTTVYPGETVEINIDMAAPGYAGQYRGIGSCSALKENFLGLARAGMRLFG
ncbi:MAG: hypothetical protein IT308_12930 [Anaerolineaceae bacterium]|nr:hypothetical protein [Anaerolineaceae bacterium]